MDTQQQLSSTLPRPQLKKFQFFEEHNLNSVLINHRCQHQYLYIPVNASTWGKNIFSKAKFYHGTLDPMYKTTIFFKDPIDRWLSGMATWLTYRLPQHTGLELVKDNQALLDVLFDTVCQDDHTERQVFFVQDVNWSNAVCFFIDDSFNLAVGEYFTTNFGVDIANAPPEHQTTLEGGKLIPKNYFRRVLESNPKYLKRVKEFFEPDYKFLKSLPFQNSNTVNFRYYDI
jgi:hypothetical protein